MLLCKWEDLPNNMQNDAVRKYYDLLAKKRFQLIVKRIFDISVSLIMLLALLPAIIVISVAIKLDSRGPVFFRQTRITSYGKEFRIHKFRTMVNGADKKGTAVTVDDDVRITKVGKFIRKYRIDEISQLIDVLQGNMTFVGIRPEVPKYVSFYSEEMLATLLLPAGITNLTCIYYADESKLLKDAEDADKVYVEEILPQKMKWNLKGLEDFSFFKDIKLMFMTFFAMCGKEYKVETI